MCCRSLNKNKSLEISKARHSETKVVLLGDSGVGKSSILLRYTQDEFSEDFEVTIGGAYMQTQVWLEDRTPVTLDVWDTAGQERYKSLTPMYYKGASAALIVYDVTSPSSFEGAKDWIKELQTHASPSVIIGLCGNKADLEKKVTSETAKSLAERHSLVFYEVSACTGENVQECFLGIAKKLPQTPPRRSQGLNLQNQQVSSPDSSCC